MRRVASALVVLAALAAPLFAEDKPSSVAKEGEIPLEGGNTFDRMAIDSDAGRLYVAHALNVDVVDTAKAERLGVVEGVDRAHGVVIVPDLKRGFASAGKKNRLVVFDLATLKMTKEILAGDDPDAVLYVSATKEVWAFNAKSSNVTCVDSVSLEVKATIALGGKPEFAVEHAAKNLVYVGLVGEKDSVCVIDSRGHKVAGTHLIGSGVEPTGLALDARAGLLFVGCANELLVVLDVGSWKVVASLPIGSRCDGVALDAATGNVFVSCNGATSVVHLKGKAYQVVASLDTPGGRSCVVDPKTHKLYVASGPMKGDQGDVKVLVFAPK